MYRFTAAVMNKGRHFPVLDLDHCAGFSTSLTAEALRRKLQDEGVVFQEIRSSQFSRWYILDLPTNNFQTAYYTSRHFATTARETERAFDLRYLIYAAKRKMFLLRAIPKIGAPYPVFVPRSDIGSEEFEEWVHEFQLHWQKPEVLTLGLEMAL